MIPGKIFLESIVCGQQVSLKCKFHLIINGIFYQELRLFHNKYICLTANDQLAIELILMKNKRTSQKSGQPLILQQAQMQYQSYATASVSNGYRLILQNKTIQICFKLQNVKQTPVASFNRKKLGVLGGTSKINNIFSEMSPRSKDKVQNIYDQLANSRNVLKQSLCNYKPLGQSNYLKNSSRWSKFDHNLIQQQDSSQQNYKSSIQGESLQSLAYQRQKILGQLFGKFKK